MGVVLWHFLETVGHVIVVKILEKEALKLVVVEDIDAISFSLVRIP